MLVLPCQSSVPATLSNTTAANATTSRPNPMPRLRAKCGLTFLPVCWCVRSATTWPRIGNAIVQPEVTELTLIAASKIIKVLRDMAVRVRAIAARSRRDHRLRGPNHTLRGDKRPALAMPASGDKDKWAAAGTSFTTGVADLKGQMRNQRWADVEPKGRERPFVMFGPLKRSSEPWHNVLSAIHHQ